MTVAGRKTGFLRTPGLFFAALVPTLLIFLGVLMLRIGMIFNLSFVVQFLIIPIALLAVNIKIVRSKIRLVSRLVLCIVVLIPFALVYLVSSSLLRFEVLESWQGVEALNEYLSFAEKYPELPDEEALGEPELMKYYVYADMQLIFTSETSTLLCRYTPDEYTRMKEQINSVYTFETEPIPLKYPQIVPCAVVFDFDIRMLSMDEDRYKPLEDTPEQLSYLDYPKHMIFIGTNDRTNEILYMYYSDPDIDCIDSLEDFLREYCGLRHIL